MVTYTNPTPATIRFEMDGEKFTVPPGGDVPIRDAYALPRQGANPNVTLPPIISGIAPQLVAKNPNAVVKTQPAAPPPPLGITKEMLMARGYSEGEAEILLAQIEKGPGGEKPARGGRGGRGAKGDAAEETSKD